MQNHDILRKYIVFYENLQVFYENFSKITKIKYILGKSNCRFIFVIFAFPPSKLPERFPVPFFKPEGNFFCGGADFFGAAAAGNRTFPDHAHAPPLFQEDFDVAQVALAVSGELFPPEVGVRAWHTKFVAFERIQHVVLQHGRANQRAFAFPAVRVPKTAVHENHRPVMRKHDVGRTGKPPVVFSEPKSEPKKLRAERNFKFSARAVNRRHVFVPLLGHHVFCFHPDSCGQYSKTRGFAPLYYFLGAPADKRRSGYPHFRANRAPFLRSRCSLRNALRAVLLSLAQTAPLAKILFFV